MGFFDELIHPTRPEDVVNVRRDNVAAGEAALAGQGFTLDIYSLTANASVSFPAFLEAFSDAYDSDWQVQQVFGRMDPIAVFTGTRRAIAVSWKVVAPDIRSAKKNLYDMNKLISFLYPQYAERGDSGCGATTINMGPLMRIKFGNLIQSATNGGGLLGYVNGITFDPILEDGTFALPNKFGFGNYDNSNPTNNYSDMINEVEAKHHAQYYPKSIRLNINFTVLHEHALGFNQDNFQRGGVGPQTWPYIVSFTGNQGPRKGAAKPAGTPNTEGAAAANGSGQNPVQQAEQQKVLSGDDKQALIAAGAAGEQKNKLLANQRIGAALRKSKIAMQVARNTGS